jgi:phosphatidylserine decarboxylase
VSTALEAAASGLRRASKGFKTPLMGIAREGWPYVLTLVGAGGLLAALHWYAAGGTLLALGLFCAFFFRDPERDIPEAAGLVLSPADGKVVDVASPVDGPLGPGSTRVSIFLSIFDVHVNRAPIAGRVERVDYTPGEFLPAFDDKASLRNEQNSVVLGDGRTRVAFKQIAGLIARRIVFRKQVDDRVERGERVGLIKFGSRVDVFLPETTRLRAKRGDRVRGGSSVIGELA